MKLVAPFGFFGAGNIGDESTLQGFSRLVSQRENALNVWVASRNPDHTSRIEPSFKYYKARKRGFRRWWAGLRSDCEVIVGGTPIMDVLGNWPFSELLPLILSAHGQGKPVAFLGSGVEGLMREDSKRTVAETLAPTITRWSVRSLRDKERLVAYGVRPDLVTVAADLAWMLDPVSASFGREYLTQLGLDVDARYFGVNLNAEKFVLRKEPHLFEKIATFLDEIVKDYNMRIIFLANEIRAGDSYDNAASRKVVARMQRQEAAFIVPNIYWSPQQMLSLIRCCEATISTRYHFCLFSALQNVPFIALKRSDKVDDFCWDMDWDFGSSLFELNVDELSRMFSGIEQNKTELSQRLNRQALLMRRRAEMNNTVLDSLLLEAGIASSAQQRSVPV